MFLLVVALLFAVTGKLFIFTVLVHFIIFCEIKTKDMYSGCSDSPSEWFSWLFAANYIVTFIINFLSYFYYSLLYYMWQPVQSYLKK